MSKVVGIIGKPKVVIPDIILVAHNAESICLKDDPAYPYKLEGEFMPPDFMQVTFVALHGGSERFVVRGKTKESLDAFIELNKFKTHPRLISLTITGPDNFREEFKP